MAVAQQLPILLPSESPIICFQLKVQQTPSTGHQLKIWHFCPAIRPPTVPTSQFGSQLWQLMNHHIQRLVEALSDINLNQQKNSLSLQKRQTREEAGTYCDFLRSNCCFISHTPLISFAQVSTLQSCSW